MQHTHEQIPGVHPFLAPFISILFMLFTNVVVPSLPEEHWHVPPGLMEVSQMLAWWCVGGTFIIAVLNYFGIKWNPFKKDKK